MEESTLERKLKSEVEKAGGMCIKWVAPGKRGVPDRICFFPHGKIAFVEMKAADGKLSALQRKRRSELINLGNLVYVIDSKEQIASFIADMAGGSAS